MSCIEEDLVGGHILFNVRHCILKRSAIDVKREGGHPVTLTPSSKVRISVKSEKPCECNEFAKALSEDAYYSASYWGEDFQSLSVPR